MRSRRNRSFIDGVVEAAEKEGRDLTPQEMELVTRSRDRQEKLNEQAKPMQEAAQIAAQSQERLAEIGKLFERQNGNRPPTATEYKTAGEYVIDRWRAGLGENDAAQRLELYHRAAAHQTTADNPGLLPEQIMGPLGELGRPGPAARQRARPPQPAVRQLVAGRG